MNCKDNGCYNEKAANPNANITINTNNIKTDYNMTFGILSGLAIIMVVAGHLGYNILTLGDLFPYYSFHVPLFMFISGYFYKETEETHPFGYVVKKARRLLMTYLIWNLVYGLAAWLMRWNGFAMGRRSACGRFFWRHLCMAISLSIIMRPGLCRCYL